MSRFVLLTGSVRTESAPGSSAVRLSGAVMSDGPEQLSPTVVTCNQRYSTFGANLLIGR